MKEYSRKNHECKRTMPIIDRSEFIRFRDARYENPTWIKSQQFEGMAMLSERR